MAQIIQFFEKLKFDGNVTVNSEIFEVTDYIQLVSQLNVSTVTGTNPSISAVLQDTMDPCFAPDAVWRDAASQSLAVAGTGIFTASNLLRFARVRVTSQGTGVSFIVSVTSVARETI